MIEKKVSIIVPVYNVEKYLERSVNSIINQTYSNLEIILVDDGATDNSPKMCDDFAKKDTRIKVVHKKNGGLSDARNAGLKVACGDYIGYVDSDDWIELDMYEKMLAACEDNHADVAICRYFEEYKDHTVSGGNGGIVLFNKEELVTAYVEDNDNVVIYNSVWSKLFKRELVQGGEFPVGRNSEDIMYTTKAFCKADKAVYLDTSFYHYVQDREGSIMNEKNTNRMFNDEIPFWKEHIECISNNVSKEMGSLASYYFYRRMLSYFMVLSNKNKEAAKRIKKLILNEKSLVRSAYNTSCKSNGDKARMNLFLFNPSLYKLVNKFYENVILTIRRG